MSLRKEIETVIKTTQNRGESDQDYADRVMEDIQKISDKEWDALSDEAQKWFDANVDKIKAGKELLVLAEEREAPAARESRSRRTTAAEPVVKTPVPGDIVVVTTTRNRTYEGEFLELVDGTTAIVKVGDEEMEFTPARTLSLVVKEVKEEGQNDEIAVGDEVILTTKRNAVITGFVKELTEDYVVLDVEGKEAEYDMARVESIVPAIANNDAGALKQPVVGDWIKAVTNRNREVEGKVVEIDGDFLIINQGVEGETEVDMNTAKSIEVVGEQGKPARQQRGSKEPEPATGRTRRSTAPEGTTGKQAKITTTTNDGVSVSLRAREIICTDPELKYEAVAKQLTQEKLIFKEASLMILYKDAHRIIDLLKKAKHFK